MGTSINWPCGKAMGSRKNLIPNWSCLQVLFVPFLALMGRSKRNSQILGGSFEDIQLSNYTTALPLQNDEIRGINAKSWKLYYTSFTSFGYKTWRISGFEKIQFWNLLSHLLFAPLQCDENKRWPKHEIVETLLY